MPLRSSSGCSPPPSDNQNNNNDGNDGNDSDSEDKEDSMAKVMMMNDDVDMIFLYLFGAYNIGYIWLAPAVI